MKNHEWTDGKLLQTNKKYSHLKLKQKEKINQWMYESYRQFYLENKRFPETADTGSILATVMLHIEQAEIWIPENEVEKHYRSVIQNLRRRLQREEVQQNAIAIILEPLSVPLSVCKVEDYNGIDLDQPFCFTGRTDQEKSLVCPTGIVPDNAINREDGWRAFRICGELDFSLIGILARVTKILASNQVGIFAISTYNTDYILTKEEDYDRALSVLKNAGYSIKPEEKNKRPS